MDGFELSSNPSQDICPTGWKIPNGDQSKGSYYYLFNDANEGYNANVSDFNNALSVVLPGWLENGTIQGRGYIGHLWSSTYVSPTFMYSLMLGPSSAGPQTSARRDYGFSVRCILK